MTTSWLKCGNGHGESEEEQEPKALNIKKLKMRDIEEKMWCAGGNTGGGVRGRERARGLERERRETRNRREDLPLVAGDETESSFHASSDHSTSSSQCLILPLTYTHVPFLYTLHNTLPPFLSTPQHNNENNNNDTGMYHVPKLLQTINGINL